MFQENRHRKIFNAEMLFNCPGKCLFTMQKQADHYFVSEMFSMCIYRAKILNLSF